MDFFTEEGKNILLPFIKLAHSKTYAAPKEVREEFRVKEPVLSGNKDYDFRIDDFRYYDSYVAGELTSSGGEEIFYRGKPVWRMNYQGMSGSATPVFFKEKVNPFLKKALRQAPRDIPFRGLDGFKENDFEYHFNMMGDYLDFTGLEQVLFKGDIILTHNVMGILIR